MGIFGSLIRQLPLAEFVIFEPKDCRVATWFGGAANVFARQTPLPSEDRIRRYVLGHLYWRSVFAAERFDIFENLHLPLVKAPTGRTIFTIHDIRELHPGGGVINGFMLRRVLSRAFRDADHTITVSETVKREILELFPEAKISVIYNGLDAKEFSAFSEQDLVEFRKRLNVPEPFALAVGHLERRKNYLQLIDAFARLHANECRCSLVIIGNDSGERRAIEDRVVSKNLTGIVQVLSGLSDAQVHCAYQLCRLFVFPSRYEGFGIPLLEAMAAGKPMVVSDIPVFREITQGQGAYFDPNSSDSMASAIESVLSSPEQQAALIAYGEQRVRDFGFEELAAKMASLYMSFT